MSQFISKCCRYVPTLLEVKVNITVVHLNEKQRKLVRNCVLSPAREKDLYRLVGVVLAWSLGHGGPVLPD